MYSAPKTSQGYHTFRPTCNSYLLDLSKLSKDQKLQGGCEDSHEPSHAGIFRSSCSQSTSLTTRGERQDFPKGRFATKRGWLSEVYATDQVDDASSTAPASEIPSTMATSKSLSSFGNDTMPSQYQHESQMSHQEHVRKTWQPHWAATSPVKQQSSVSQLNATSFDDTVLELDVEKASRDEKIQAVKEALLRSHSFSSQNFGSSSQAISHSITFSPPPRKRSLRRRSERTAELQRRKNSAFGEIRAPDHEMCAITEELTQDLLTAVDDELQKQPEAAAVLDNSEWEISAYEGAGEPRSTKRIGDQVNDSIGELHGLSKDVDELTRDLRALKHLLQGER